MKNISDYIRTVCRIGQMELCCKYLMARGKGFECGKYGPSMKAVIDKAWAEHEHVAQGDNCEGVENLQTAIIPEP